MYAMGFSETMRRNGGALSIASLSIELCLLYEIKYSKSHKPENRHCVQKIIVIEKNKLCLLNCLSEKQSSLRNYSYIKEGNKSKSFSVDQILDLTGGKKLQNLPLVLFCNSQNKTAYW